jgi:UDPglucose 6-dehydrogenase
MKLAIIGTGYVGLVSGTCFSDLGHDVVCADIDAKKIERLNAGEIPIYEPGLEDMVKTSVEQGRLQFTTDVANAIDQAQVIFIAVGTPPMDDGTAELKYVFEVARTVGRTMTGYKVIVDKSTVPVGTAAKVTQCIEEELAARNVTHDFDVVSNPEFLKEGSAIEDFMHPDRVVIGCENGKARKVMEELYVHFAKNGRPIIFMSTKSAEMTKYAANAMLATKISFINEVANICEKTGANVDDVRNGIGSDSRIGYRFIFPGIGYGGSCFPKDVKALIQTASEVGTTAHLLNAVDAVNDAQKFSLLEKMQTYYKGNLAGKRFALWGLAFKPETDDVREAPALLMVEALLKAGAEICAYDPKAAEQAVLYLGERDEISYVNHYYEAVEGCDALILATEWPFFRNTDLARVKKSLKTPVLFDGRNVYNPAHMAELGYDYFSIGRDPVFAHSNA